MSDDVGSQHGDSTNLEETQVEQTKSEEPSRYTDFKEIGSGAFGNVYKATDSELNRTVAIKVLNDKLQTNDDAIKRFRREGKALAQFDDANICAIFDAYTHNDKLYLVFPFIDGETLADRLKRGLSIEQAIDITVKVADAIHYGHQKKIIHRDLKPANIMFRHDSEEPIVMDFGMCHWDDDEQPSITWDGQQLGTPNYMSPEQAAGEGCTAATDQFCLAVMLQEMLSGQRPFQAKTPAKLLQKIINDEPAEPTDRSGAPLEPALTEVLKRALQKKPEDRFENINEFARVLEKCRPKPKPLFNGPQNLPFKSLDKMFMGREQAMGRLQKSLRRDSGRASAITAAQAVHGLGGVGKTRLAVEYAWQYARDYSALLFVTADSQANLKRELAELTEPEVLNLAEQQATDQDSRMRGVLSWLQSNSGWLLIFDNVDSEEAAEQVDALLPRLTSGHVLITSRLTTWDGSVKPIALDVLSETEAAEFLLARTKPQTSGRGRTPQDSDAQDAQTLAKELDGLALALEQAGSYISAKRISLTEYLRRWQSHNAKVQTWHRPREMKCPASVATTWMTTIEQIKLDHGPATIDFLNILAWFAPEPIPQHVFDHLGQITDLPASLKLDEGMNGKAESAEIVEEYLEILANFSLIQWESETVIIHRVIQEILRSQQWEEDTAIRAALQMLNVASPTESYDVVTWPILDPLRPHLAAIAHTADQAEINEPTTRIMAILAELLAAKALYSEAEPFQRRALQIGEQTYGPDHPEVATHLNNLAQLLKATNRLSVSEPLMRRALQIDEQTYGPDHPRVATRLNNLAQLLQDTNRLSKSEPLMRRALQIDEQTYGPDHPDVATRLNNLALLLQATNRIPESEPLMRRALQIGEQTYGPDHPTVATHLNNLAGLLKATNRLSESEPLMRRVLQIDEQTYGPDHPRVATDLNNLATLLQATNRLSESEPLIRRALTILESSLGPDHPTTQTASRNLELIEEELAQQRTPTKP